jgi:hypothetical protein
MNTERGLVNVSDDGIRTSIGDGLAHAVTMHRYFTGESAMIRPEYLSTVAIAESLFALPEKGKIPFNETDYRILFEHPTDSILNHFTFLKENKHAHYTSRSSWLQQTAVPKTVHVKRRLSRFRHGRIDLFIHPTGEALNSHPRSSMIHCIEVKNIDPAKSGVVGDLKRLYDLVAHGDGIDHCTVTGWLALTTTDQEQSTQWVQAAHNHYRTKQHQLGELKPYWFAPIVLPGDDENDADTKIYLAVVRVGKRDSMEKT